MVSAQWYAMDDREKRLALEVRFLKILPEEYQGSYEEVQPVSMGSAGLKYGQDGLVAWNEIWGSFCDLAMAGGPPHKGKLLQPGTREEIEDQPDRYGEVTAEICRGVRLAAELDAFPSETPGWISVQCDDETMAEWLARAIVMENVWARCDGDLLGLPAGPAYRIQKEIKNVITSIAKTAHYWLGHMWSHQHQEIGEIFRALREEHALVQPAAMGHGFDVAAHSEAAARMAETIPGATGLSRAGEDYPGWIGFACPTVADAIWKMRALAAFPILARREETTLYLPVNPALDPGGEYTAATFLEVHRLHAVGKVG